MSVGRVMAFRGVQRHEYVWCFGCSYPGVDEWHQVHGRNMGRGSFGLQTTAIVDGMLLKVSVGSRVFLADSAHARKINHAAVTPDVFGPNVVSVSVIRGYASR